MPTAEEVRHQLVKDLLQSELTYVKQLHGCLTTFRTPLESKQIVNNLALNRIFSNIDQIFEFTKTQCAAIRERVQQWDEWQSVADIFAFSAEVWSDLYCTYVQNYLAAVRCVRQQEHTNRRFAAFVAEQRRNNGASLLKMLALPLNRLTTYHVILCQLLRRTDGSHPDFDNLEAAVDSANIMVGEMDEACSPLARCRERMNQVTALLAAIEAEVPLPSIRNGVQRAASGVQKLCAGFLPGPAGSPVTVPHRADQLEALHTAVTDIETVLTQLKNKPGALQRVRQSGLPPALQKRFDEQSTRLASLFDTVFGDALRNVPSPNNSNTASRPVPGGGSSRASPGAQAMSSSPQSQPNAGPKRNAPQRTVSSGGFKNAQVAAAQQALAAGMGGGPRRPSGAPMPNRNAAISPRAGLPRASMLGSSNGAAAVIDDEEGQLMWTETFGGNTKQVTCAQFFAGLERYLESSLNTNEKRLLQYVINMGVEEQSIDVELFAGFLKGFGPLTSCLHNVKSILGSNWFYGFLTHNEAIRLLETEPIGAYLVRFSLSRPGSFALEATILDASGQPFVLPIQINSTADGGFAIHESEAGDREFPSLHELISYYTAYLQQPLDSTIPFEVWFHGDISSGEAAGALEGQPDGTFLLRFSSRAGCYASSFVEEGRVRHALILSVDGGYCVEGDNHVYATVPKLVAGFNAGLQVPLVNAENQLKQQIFAIAEQELQTDSDPDDRNALDSSGWDANNSYQDPADFRGGLPSRASQMQLGVPNRNNPRAQQQRQQQQLPQRQAQPAAPAAEPKKAFSDGGVGASSGLVYMKDSKAVKGGTLEGLVEHLLENTASKFAKCFLLTYESFTTPAELLTLLQARYTYFCQHNGETIESKKLRLRICNFLKSWAQKHFASTTQHDDDDEFQLAFQTFAERHIRPMDGANLANQLLKTLSKALEQRQKIVSNNETGAAPFVFSSKPPKPELPKKFDSGDWQWYDVSAVEIARQMTLIEEELFRAITPNELIGLAWTKKDKERRSPNLLKLIHRFNEVSDWVKSTIVQERDLKKRTKIYEKFLEIAVQLGKLNNYNAAMEISAALESAAIFRLKKTKAKVSNKLVSKYDEVHAKLSRAQSYKALREAIHSSNPPIIPYFGMYLSDLTFIEEGNNDFLSDSEPKLINYQKRRLISQVIDDEINQYQQAPYNLQKVPALRERLQLCLHSDIVDDDKSYALSLEIEPREQS